MNSQRETYSSFEEFWENANRRLTDFNEKQARMIWQAATEQGVGEAAVPMPTTVAQAKGMVLVGTSWLEANAPGELKPTGGGVPEGYVLVPIEMTEAMIKAFNRADKMYESGLGEAPDIHWRHILRATQQPPGQE